MSKINVVEMFKSVQGEGNEAGKITTFVRLGGCDFRCPWCDSKHTWKPNENGQVIEVQELVKQIEQIGVKHITFTGGNPCIWNEPMAELLLELKKKEYHISMETQGSQFRPWIVAVDNLVISPKNIDDKYKNMDEVKYKETINEIIKVRTDLNLKTIVKTPIFNQGDLEWVKNFVNFDGDYEIYLSVGNDWVDMEDGMQFKELILERYKWLIETVLEDEWFTSRLVSVLPQVHTLVWCNKAGV